MKRELVGVNREMSIIIVKEIHDDGTSRNVNIDISSIDIDNFAKLCSINPESLSKDFFAEIDLMLDEASNPNLKDKYTRFLTLRERMMEGFLYSSWSNAGCKIANNEETLYDRPKFELSDVVVQVDRTTGEVVGLLGVYTPEFFRPYFMDFDFLNKEQRYGFIQSMPKGFIDEKMFAYFYNGTKNRNPSNIDIYNIKDLKNYLKIKNKFNMDDVLNGFAKHDTVMHEYAIDKLYCDEPNV